MDRGASWESLCVAVLSEEGKQEVKVATVLIPQRDVLLFTQST